MPAVALTEKQQTFLDNYIRAHSILGRKKKGDAEDFRRRKGKVLDYINGLPNFPEINKDLNQMVAAADKQADEGNFKDAYHSLKAAKKAAKQRIASYDPLPDIKKLQDECGAFCIAANEAGGELSKLATWINGPGMAQVNKAQQIPQELGKIGDKQAAVLRANQVEKLETTLWEEWKAAADYSKVEKFLGNAAAKETDLKRRHAELLKSAKTDEQNLRMSSVQKQLEQQLAGNAKIRPVRTGDCQYAEAASYLSSLKRPFELQFKNVHQALAQFQEGRDRGGDSPVKNEGPEMNQAILEELRDGMNLKQKALPNDRDVRDKEKFDMAEFTTAYRQPTLEDRDYAPDDPAMQRLKLGAKAGFGGVIGGLDASGGEFFDISLKSKEGLGLDYAESRGWGRDPKVWSKAQIATVEAMSSGMFAAVQEKSPNKVDLSNPKKPIITLNGEQYQFVKQLGEGGGGAASRYETLTDPKKRIVIKSPPLDNLGQPPNPDERSKMEQEIRNNRHLSEGEETTGHDKVLGYKGAIQGPDGTLFMAMEEADGGSLVDTQKALTLAGSNGSLPEEVRGILNQFMFKQTVEGMMYLRDNNMVHMDMKPGNVFMMADGTVRVADFGESVVSDTSDGSIPITKDQGYTQGFYPKEVPESIKNDLAGTGVTDLDDKADAFALGKTAQAMHLGQQGMAHKWGIPVEQQGLIGALERVTGGKGGLTSESEDERPTLEAVLNSSYLKNLDNFDEAVIQELMRAVVELGKVDGMEQVERIKGNHTLASESVKKIEIEMKKPNLDNERKLMLEKEWKKARELAASYEEQLKKLADNPKAKAITEDIRLLSQQLLRPSGESGPPNEKDTKEFYAKLGSAASSPREFTALLRQPSNFRFFKAAGLAQREAIAAFAAVDEIDLTAKNPRAIDDLEAVKPMLEEYLKKVKNRDFGRILQRAATAALTYLEKQYDFLGKERGGGTVADYRKARQQVLDTVTAGQAFLQNEKQKMDQRLAVGQNQSDDAQGIAKQTLQLIANGYPPRPEGPAREFQEFKDNVANVKSECERALQLVRQQFVQNMPTNDVLKQYQLETPAKNAGMLIDQMEADIDRKCFSYDQWIDQAAESAMDALAGKVDQIAAYEKILLVDVKKLTRDDWAPVGGADSSIANSMTLLGELMEQLKVLVDLPG